MPNKPLEQQVQARRRELAEQQLAAVEHSMALENQSVENRENRERLLQTLSEQIDSKRTWSEQ